MKAMIFAAGLRKRLGSLSANSPKALVDINGKSVLHRAVEYVTAAGFNEIIINVHHFADMVDKEIRLLRKQGFNLSVSDERDLLLETGGGLYKAKSFFSDEPFLLYNTDIITTLDLGKLYDFHAQNRSIATLAVAERNDDRVFLVNRSGILCGWMNRSTSERIISSGSDKELTGVCFSGIHIADPSIFSFMKDGVYSLTALYLEIARTEIINTYRHDGDFWADAGTPEEVTRIRQIIR